MKFRLLPCLECKERKLQHQHYVQGAELNDDLIIRLKCPQGHTSAYVYDTQKFEVLFDMGVSALLDGYTREAVSSFAACQERFHEFCVKVFLAKQGVSRTDFKAAWKLVASQSERQLGAYYFLHLLHFKRVPTTSPKIVEFRNNVIHRGYIPAFAETSNYGRYVYDFTIAGVNAMRPALAAEIREVCATDLEERLNSIPAGVVKKAVPVPSLIWLSGPVEKFGKRSFQEALKAHKEDHRTELEDRLQDLDEQEEQEDQER